ncbi:hypothetical protein, partial [Aegicerativicinus sediminis]
NLQFLNRMESNKNENIDKLLRSLIKDQTLEVPSADFKMKLLQKIEKHNKINSIESQPLISMKTIVISIAISIIAIIYYLVKGNPAGTDWWGLDNPILQFELPSFNIFPNFQSGYIFIYAFVVLAIMFYIQVYYLSARYNNQS